MPIASYLAIVSPKTLRKIASKGRSVFLIGGGESFTAYSIVISAITQAPIPLVTARRETSIVLALAKGVFFSESKPKPDQAAVHILHSIGCSALAIRKTLILSQPFAPYFNQHLNQIGWLGALKLALIARQSSPSIDHLYCLEIDTTFT